MNKDLHHKEILCIFIVMNLQENIDRIHEIMGTVITEDNKTLKIQNMIDGIGLLNTFKFFGGYNNFINVNEDFVIDEEVKIRFIKDTVEYLKDLLDDEQVVLEDYDEEPIFVSEGPNFIRLIEVLEKEGAGTSVYKKTNDGDSWLKNETIPYDEIGDGPLNDVFLFLLEIMERD
jgi:hypothetical protein